MWIMTHKILLPNVCLKKKMTHLGCMVFVKTVRRDGLYKAICGGSGGDNEDDSDI